MSIRKRIIKPKKLLRHTLPDNIEIIPKLPDNLAHHVERVYAPYCGFTMKASRFPKEMWKVPRTNIICGVCFSRWGTTLGEDAVAWFCTTLAFEAYEPTTEHGFQVAQPLVKGMKPRYVFIDKFKTPKGGTPLDAREAAYAAIYEAYEDHHGVNLFAE